MSDFAYVVLILAFFALSWGFVLLCDGSRPEAR